MENYRWFVFTDKGRKVTWAPSSEAARKKAEDYGFKVSKVSAAPSILYESES